ncbi:MAG: sigma-70 family RNA polymerase sigma factor [bacterium]
MVEETDELLVEKIKKGNDDAFRDLIRRYQRYVLNLVYRTIGDTNDAEDIAQEVFIKVYKSIRGFKGESKFSTWISKITVNVCMDKLREKSKNKEEDIEEEAWNTFTQPVNFSPEVMAERHELQETIKKAIESLPEELRAAFVLRELENLSYEEIGEMLNIPIGTVESRIYRARMKLRSYLKDLWSVEEVERENEMR